MDADFAAKQKGAQDERGHQEAFETPMTQRILDIDSYPCYWPDGWERTAAHKRTSSRYSIDFARARDNVVHQCKLLGAREVVISSNVPLRRDGLPLAGQSEPKDPSVAVYWVEPGAWNIEQQRTIHPRRVIACDAWRKVRENMRAVGLAIEAMRQLKRCGATQVVERAFMGFNALPAQAGPNSNGQRPWREVFGWASGTLWTTHDIEQRFRMLCFDLHPDRGGTHEAMAELNHAYAQALQECRP